MGGMRHLLWLYLPCSLSAGLWTGAHCLSGSAGGKALCSKTERKRVHLDTEAGNVRTMTETPRCYRRGSRLASIPGYAKFTHLSLRGIFICRTAKGRNKLVECTGGWLLQYNRAPPSSGYLIRRSTVLLCYFQVIISCLSLPLIIHPQAQTGGQIPACP